MNSVLQAFEALPDIPALRDLPQCSPRESPPEVIKTGTQVPDGTTLLADLFTTDIGERNPFSIGFTTPAAIAYGGWDEDGQSVRWTWGTPPLVVGAPDGTEGAVLSELLDSPPPPVTLRVAESGLVATVENLDEVREVLLDGHRALSELEGGPAFDPSRYETMSDEAVAAIAIADVQVYHAAEGYEFELGVPASTSDLLPNHLGGAPYPATTNATTAFDPSTSCGLVHLVTELDRESAGPILSDSLRPLFPDAGSEEFDELIADTEVRNQTFIWADTKSGQIRRVRVEQTVRVGPSGNVRIVDIGVVTELPH